MKITRGLFKLTWPKVLIGAFILVASVSAVLGLLFSYQGSSKRQVTATDSDPKENSTRQEGTTPFTTNFAGTGASSSERIDIDQYPDFTTSFSLKDIIRPIYDPQFITADQADLGEDEYVMGVAINGDARSYPIGPLTRREMVNDVVGGVPILVTW